MTGPDDRRKMQGGSMNEQEQRVIGLLHALRAERAPERLRADIERLRAAPRREHRQWRVPAFGLATATGTVAVAATVVALTVGGTAVSPVLQAASLALRAPTAAAPTPNRAAPQMRLNREVQELYFPNWARFGWWATGQRVDSLDGHQAVTVFYGAAGRSIAYTILTAPPMSQPSTPATTFRGTQFRTLHQDVRLVVTWRRNNHTCVLSGVGVTARQLYALAAWHPAGSDY
jgi:hypothetical protein